jgi:hypothetical protein
MSKEYISDISFKNPEYINLIHEVEAQIRKSRHSEDGTYSLVASIYVQ